MKIPFKKKFPETADTLLRRCSYAKQFDKRMQKTSYFKRLTTQHFPKFHVYVESEDPLTLGLHLDQKPHTYSGQRAHQGEHDTNVVRAEALRLWNTILGLKN